MWNRLSHGSRFPMWLRRLKSEPTRQGHGRWVGDLSWAIGKLEMDEYSELGRWQVFAHTAWPAASHMTFEILESVTSSSIEATRQHCYVIFDSCSTDRSHQWQVNAMKCYSWRHIVGFTSFAGSGVGFETLVVLLWQTRPGRLPSWSRYDAGLFSAPLTITNCSNKIFRFGRLSAKVALANHAQVWFLPELQFRIVAKEIAN